MNPLSHILAATDLSASSRHAINRGFHIAADTGARYSVMHAMELDAIDSLSDMLGKNTQHVKQRLEDEARDFLRKILAEAKRNRGVAAEAMIVFGVPLEAIANQADAIDADLLVIGARGESFFRHVLLGSTASRLLRKSIRRPVLVVKQPPHEPYRRVLIPVDFSPVSLHAIRLARQLAPAADILLLHAFELPYEGKLVFAGVEENLIHQYIQTASEGHRRKIHQLAESAGLAATDYSVRIRHGDPSLQIVAQEQEQGSDLIVMGKHGMHLTEELLLGSVTKHVLAESQCDVLILTDGRLPQGDDNDV